jgi:hypothetical protein
VILISCTCKQLCTHFRREPDGPERPYGPHFYYSTYSTFMYNQVMVVTGNQIFKLILLGSRIFGWLCLALSLSAQLWNGVIAPSRAVDFTQAGFPGGTLPDASWTQCATTACAAVTSAGSSATVTQINAALASATSNTYVAVAAGTYNFTSPIVISDYGSLKSNIVLRGAGADKTKFVFSGAGTGGGCFNSVVSLEGSCFYLNGGEENVCVFAGASLTSTVTAGTYAQGGTYLSITNCGSSTPATGSLSNLSVGSIIMVDQLDETNDTGTIWNCDNSTTANGGVCAGNGSGGSIRENGPCNNGGLTCDRAQVQGFTVLGISGSVVHVSPGLYMPQWRTSQQPQAVFPNNTVSGVGVESLSVDMTAACPGSACSFTSTYSMLVCNQCWIAGVRSIDANRSHLRLQYSTHSVLRDNYMYENQSGGSSSYGFEVGQGWNNLLENNIAQQVTDSDPSCTGPCAGNVMDYNFSVDNAYTTSNGYIVPPLFLHAGGDVFNLWEGNIAVGFSGDNIHGTHHFETVYRNTLPGWQSVCAGGPCLYQTIPITLPSGDRYMNIIGNVLGEPGYHTAYQCIAPATCSTSAGVSGKDTMIFEVAYTLDTYPVTYTWCSTPACSSAQSYDVQTASYLMRWGNYDVITGTNRFCGNSSDAGWSTTCSSTSEVPTAIASYSNPIPTLGDTVAGQSAMPASFYYSSKPAFLGSIPWPVAGPDVTGGNLGNCSGGTYAGMAAISSTQCSGGTLVTAWSGHANANAAATCYLNTMAGPPDGTGSVLSFNAATCYPLQTQTAVPTPALTLTKSN